jgi:acetyl esterase/lipase
MRCLHDLDRSLSERVDPELRPGLAVWRASWRPLPREDFTAFREQHNRQALAALAGTTLPATVEIEDVVAPGPPGDPPIRIRLYRPANAGSPAPGLYFVHGGGMVLGLVETSDAHLCDYVQALGCVAASVDYRLAPEHPHPAPVEDCYAGLRWFADHAEELGIDPARLAIYGRSAGGGLAAGTALLARDRGGPTLAFQLLVAPMLDDRAITHSSTAFGEHIVWGPADNATGWWSLLGDRTATDDVPIYAAPARADDLAGLPPTLVEVGELETFRDECIEYARRLLEAGVATELHVYPGAFHSFDQMAPDSSLARRAHYNKLEALRRAFQAGNAALQRS